MHETDLVHRIFATIDKRRNCATITNAISDLPIDCDTIRLTLQYYSSYYSSYCSSWFTSFAQYSYACINKRLCNGYILLIIVIIFLGSRFWLCCINTNGNIMWCITWWYIRWCIIILMVLTLAGLGIYLFIYAWMVNLIKCLD